MTETFTPGLVALLAGLSIFLLLYAILAPKKPLAKDTLSDDFFAENGADSLEEPSLFDKYLRPALRNFLPQSPLSASLSGKERTRIEQLLIRSGNPWKIRPEEYYGIQLMLAFVGFVAGLIIGILHLLPVVPPFLVVIIFTVIGYFIPRAVHNTRLENRSKEIQRQLPESLDLLVVTLTAGSNFEPALESVAERLPKGLLKEELSKVSTEIRSGRSIQNSLQAFANRAANDEAESFAKAVVQAQILGADVSETLASQANNARTNYEALLERKTARLQTTLFIPLILTMLPALLIIFLAPTLSQLSSGIL